MDRNLGGTITIDVDYARFRQQLLTRPTRRTLGLELDQSDVLAILGDETACRALYEQWRTGSADQ